MKTFFAFFLLGILSTPCFAKDFYLSPEGNDDWSGQLQTASADGKDGPVRSMDGARDAVRRYRAERGKSEEVRVMVADGTYFLTHPFVLNAEDGGTKEAPVSYLAVEGSKPIFSGGRVIQNWQKGSDGVWQTKLDSVASGDWHFEQLWVNGQRAIRARAPNVGVESIQKVEEKALTDEKIRAVFTQALQSITTDPNSVAKLDQVSPKDRQDVNFVIYEKWSQFRRFVDQFDPQSGTVVTRGQGIIPFYISPEQREKWGAKGTWIMENARAFLDAPGEWFLARDGVLSYMPRPGEDMASAVVIAPAVDSLLEIHGDPGSGALVSQITLKGLEFAHSQLLTPPEGTGLMQASADLPAAVTIDYASDIHLEKCAFRHLGAWGLWFRDGVVDSRVTGSVIQDLGAGGVRIGNLQLPKRGIDLTSHVLIEDCTISEGGRSSATGVGVWIAFSQGNTLRHCEISDFFYSGISVGWRWGYDASNCQRNIIEYNHVHHLGQHLLSDLGGVYTLGPALDTKIRNNVFHDIYSYDYGGWGMYTDEGSTGAIFENNLVYHTRTGSIHQHYGKDNIFRNNILVSSETHQLSCTRVEDHLSLSFENNIVYWTNDSPLFRGPWKSLQHQSSNNLYWSTAGPIQFAGMEFKQWQEAGHDEGSRVADPLFVDPEKGDYRLQENSPALEMGFKPFNYRKAGRLTQ